MTGLGYIKAYLSRWIDTVAAAIVELLASFRARRSVRVAEQDVAVVATPAVSRQGHRAAGRADERASSGILPRRAATGNDAAGPSTGGLGSAGLGSAGLDSAGLDSAGLDSAGLGSAGARAGGSSAGGGYRGTDPAGARTAVLDSAGHHDDSLASAGLAGWYGKLEAV